MTDTLIGKIVCSILLLQFMLIASLSGQQILVQPYLQNAAPDSMTIMWESAAIGTGEVVFGTSPFSLADTILSTNQIGQGASFIHTSSISNLIPATKYYYKVIMEDMTSSGLYHFVTPSNSSSEKATQFIAISDMQRDGSQPNKFQEIIEEGIIPIIGSEIGNDFSDLEAILIPGDLVVTGGNYPHWKEYFFNPADSLSPFVPIYPVPGNHEYHGGGLPNFIKYFSLPENGPVDLNEQAWFKDLSNVRIIGLNSNANSVDKLTQLIWLDDVLNSACSNANIDFIFAELHHPYKSELWTPGESSFTGDVVEKLEDFTEQCGKASIHFFGHTHGYSRGQSENHEHLWVNVATAGGAIDNWGEFPNADYAEFSKSQDEYGFVLLNVKAGDEPTINLKRFGRGDQDNIENNVLRDEITLKKNEFPPYQPQNIFPIGQEIQQGCITLKSSAFYGIDDTHQASQWQVALSGNFQDSLVAQKWLQSENWYNEVNTQLNDDLTDVEIDNLDPDQTYHWRVRHRDQYLKWSEWSEPSTFFLTNGGTEITGNLIINNGAENGVANWTGDIEALENGECDSVTPYDGDFNFGVGGICANESNVGFAEQFIDLTDYSADIDNDLLSVKLQAFMRNYSGGDVPELYLEFYDDVNLLLTTASISNTTATWTNKVLSAPIPIGTRSCKVILKGTRNAGSDNDSYFDEIQLVLTDRLDCPVCIGDSNVDADNDGFCDDLDCDDQDASVYPGAVETCGMNDNNCDGLSDMGDVVTYTGSGVTSEWSDPKNWDQQFVPLACQHVVIPAGFIVDLIDNFACKSMLIESGSELNVLANSQLIVDSQYSVNVASVEVVGKLTVNGKVIIRENSLDAVLVKAGGEVINLGKVVVQ